MVTMKSFGFIALASALLFGGVAVAQNFPRWNGTLVGIADYTGAQFSSANPFPVSVNGSVAPGSTPVTVSTPIVASSLTPAVHAAAYAAGNSIGGLLSFTNAARVAGGSGLIQSAVLSFTSGSTPATDLFLFSASPTASTITDNAAIAIASADVGKVIGVIHVTDCSLGGATAPSLCQAQTQAVPFDLPSGTTVFGALVARTSATLTSTTDLTATIQTLQN